MATRALQIGHLLSPVLDPNTGSVCGADYTVYFYSAGTTTAKNVWTEKEKTNPFTSYSMGSDGTVQLYGDGIYKIVIKDADDATIHEWDNIIIQVITYSGGTYSQSTFSYKNANTVYIGPGLYEVNEKIAYINSTLTSPSHGFSDEDIIYLYIDYSSIPTDGIIDNTDIYWSTAEPEYNDSQKAYYHQTNTDDRCIFGIGIYSDAIEEFFHNGNMVFYAMFRGNYAGQEPGSAYTDVTALPRVPSFSRIVDITVLFSSDAADEQLNWRTNGQAATSGHLAARPYQPGLGAYAYHAVSHIKVLTDENHVIEMKCLDSVTNNNNVSIYVDGFYLPNGI